MLSGSFMYAAGDWRKCLAYAARSIAAWPPAATYILALPLRRIRRRLRGIAHAEPVIETS